MIDWVFGVYGSERVIMSDLLFQFRRLNLGWNAPPPPPAQPAVEKPVTSQTATLVTIDHALLLDLGVFLHRLFHTPQNSEHVHSCVSLPSSMDLSSGSFWLHSSMLTAEAPI